MGIRPITSQRRSEFAGAIPAAIVSALISVVLLLAVLAVSSGRPG